jgi:hypothetical protein
MQVRLWRRARRFVASVGVVGVAVGLLGAVAWADTTTTTTTKPGSTTTTQPGSTTTTKPGATTTTQPGSTTTTTKPGTTTTTTTQPATTTTKPAATTTTKPATTTTTAAPFTVNSAINDKSSSSWKTVCYEISNQSKYKNWDSTALPSDRKGFKNLNTNFEYTVVLRGREIHAIDNNGKKYWHFEPQKFAIEGNTDSDSGANPKGYSLGGSTTFGLVSSKSGPDFALSIPFGVSASWQSNKTERLLVNSAWAATALHVTTGDMGWANALVGAAGSSTDLKQINIHSSVIPGAGAGAFNSPSATWKVLNYYETYNTNPGYGMTGYGCSGIDWSN